MKRFNAILVFLLLTASFLTAQDIKVFKAKGDRIRYELNLHHKKIWDLKTEPLDGRTHEDIKKLVQDEEAQVKKLESDLKYLKKQYRISRSKARGIKGFIRQVGNAANPKKLVQQIKSTVKNAKNALKLLEPGNFSIFLKSTIQTTAGNVEFLTRGVGRVLRNPRNLHSFLKEAVKRKQIMDLIKPDMGVISLLDKDLDQVISDSMGTAIKGLSDSAKSRVLERIKKLDSHRLIESIQNTHRIKESIYREMTLRIAQELKGTKVDQILNKLETEKDLRTPEAFTKLLNEEIQKAALAAGKKIDLSKYRKKLIDLQKRNLRNNPVLQKKLDGIQMIMENEGISPEEAAEKWLEDHPVPPEIEFSVKDSKGEKGTRIWSISFSFDRNVTERYNGEYAFEKEEKYFKDIDISRYTKKEFSITPQKTGKLSYSIKQKSGVTPGVYLSSNTAIKGEPVTVTVNLSSHGQISRSWDKGSVQFDIILTPEE